MCEFCSLASLAITSESDEVQEFESPSAEQQIEYG